VLEQSDSSGQSDSSAGRLADRDAVSTLLLQGQLYGTEARRMTDRDVGVDAFRALLGELTQDGDAFGIRYGVHSLVLRSSLERRLDTTKLYRGGKMSQPAHVVHHSDNY
jgi:hypothetical protein